MAVEDYSDEQMLKIDAYARSLRAPQAARELGWVNGDLTDLGNCRRLVSHIAGRLRYAPQLHAWLVWDGVRWAEDVTGKVDRMAKAVTDRLLAEAQEDTEPERRKALVDHWRRSQSAQRVAAMIELARTEPGIPVTVDQLDRDPWKLNVQNGVVDLQTGELHPHNPDDLHTKLCPVEYDPEAEAPRFLSFLDGIFKADEDVIGFNQRYAGYSLTGDVSEQVMVFDHGDGANGKTTFLGALRYVVGDYGMQLDPAALTIGTHDQHPTALTDLRGARLVTTIETEGGKRLAEALVKQLTGGDPIRARRMRENYFEFLPTHKIWFAGNHLPRIRGTDLGMWRRIALVPFEVTFALPDQDHGLPAKLAEEGTGILAWMVRGCLEWQRTGLRIPEKVTQATKTYRDGEDHVGRFLAERCEQGDSKSVSARALRDAYETWCSEQGEHPWTAKSLGQEFVKRGFDSGRAGHGGKETWTGFAVLDDLK